MVASAAMDLVATGVSPGFERSSGHRPMIPVFPASGDAIFDTAIRRVLEHEGHFSDHPNDPGGPTRWGISLRFAKSIGLDVDMDGDVDIEDIRKLPLERAVAVYREHWWDRYGYGQFGLTIGGRVFGFAVNMGARPAHRVLQRALRAATGVALVDDGFIGPKTRQAFADAEVKALLPALRAEAAGHYRVLVASNQMLRPFLRGWEARAYA